MGVPVDQSGHRQRALEIDDLGRRADVRLDLGRRADRDDRVAAYRDRLRHRSRFVYGDDFAALQDEVGRSDRSGGAILGGDGGERADDQRGGEEERKRPAGHGNPHYYYAPGPPPAPM